MEEDREIIVPLKCACGNRDDTGMLAPPCSADCGRRMTLDNRHNAKDMIAIVDVNGLNLESFYVIDGSHIVNIRYSSEDKIGVLVMVNNYNNKNKVVTREQISAVLDCIENLKTCIVNRTLGFGQG